MPIKNITGAVAEGEDFFDRETEQRRIWSKLQDNANLALLAPRRVGKTSLLKRLKTTADAHGYRAVYLDVGDAADERVLVEHLAQAVLAEKDAESILQRLSNSPFAEPFKNIKKIGAFGVSVEMEKAQASWDKLGQNLAETLHKMNGRWLLQIDELPVFLLKLLQPEDTAARQRTREFLYWLRRLRNDYPSIQWIFAGSIGLDAVAERYRFTDAVNDLTIFRLEAYEHSVADRFLEALANSYHLHLPPDVRSYLMQDELGRPDSDFALLLLNAICKDPQGASRDTLSQLLAARLIEAEAKDEKLRYLLKVLSNDGYLVETQNRYCFRSFLLREYWRRQVAA